MNTFRTLAIYSGVTFTATLGEFVSESLQQISVWLLVMFLVIITDLIMGLYRVVKVREMKVANGIALDKSDVIRWSKGFRDTMMKIAAYFAFVVTFCFMAQASEIECLHKVACLAVIAVEGISIAGNLLKAHGYKLNKQAVINAAAQKVGIPENIITEDKNE